MEHGSENVNGHGSPRVYCIQNETNITLTPERGGQCGFSPQSGT